MKKWYRSWFNSPYYHILYANRDNKEAQAFIDQLYILLKPTDKQRALDAGCGRGRHSIYLNKKGLDVIGIDLSQQNILYAQKFENENLHFLEHDIRKLFYTNYFDFVFNLFTSFGYFQKDLDDLKAVHMFSHSLKLGGTLVLDYINANSLSNNVIKEKKCLEGIEFVIEKKIINRFIKKTISFIDQGKSYEFSEEVKALTLADFQQYFSKKNLEITHVFGDYQLSAFDPNTSPRLILVAKRIK